MLIVIASFVGVLLIVIGAYWFFVLRPEGAQERALRRRLSVSGPVRVIENAPLLNRDTPLSSVPALEKVLRQSSALVQPLERLIELSGLRMTVGLFVLLTLFSGALAFAVLYQFTRQLLICGAVAAVFAAIPYVVVSYAAKRRIARFEELFPEAIDLMARALRAGHALTTGLGMVADEIAEPVRSEFKLLHDRQNYGMPFPEALRSFAQRVPLLDARFFATAVLTQREAGGNLAEVLDNLANIIRERFKLKRQVRTMSAHGRITGWILGLLPFIIGAALHFVAPGHVAKLFTDPLGLRLVAVALLLQVIGVFAIRKIVNIEI